MAREDTPTGELFTVLLENAFPNHPYGKHVVGTRETVNSIDRETISSYYNGYYAPNNAIFVIMGGVDSEKVLPKVYESFKDWGKKGIPERELPTIRIENRKEVAKTREGIKEAYLSIGYVVPGCDKSSQYPLELLSFILGSGKSSRLYQALVVEGLASSVYAGMSGTKGQQLLTITATCDQEDIPKVEKAIKKEIRSLAKKGVTEDELKKARNTYKASLAMSAQNLMNDAVTVAMYETLHKMGPEEYLAKLDSITAKEVQKAAKDNLNKGYVIVSLTPGGNK
jgi:zinc protease